VNSNTVICFGQYPRPALATPHFFRQALPVHLVEVIPLSRSARVESLSYFSAEPVAPGQLAKIDVRRKKMWGLVTAVRDAEDAKAEIRSSDFQLKRLGKIAPGALVRAEFAEAAREAARWHAAEPGAVLASFVPASIAERPPATALPAAAPRGNRVAAKYCVMDRDQDRFAEYRSVVRQELARRRSVLFLVPTAEDARVAAESLGKGIQDSCFELSSAVSPKLQHVRWTAAAEADRPIVVVATPAFMGLPRADWGAIVLERESSPAYRTRRRPSLDCRYLAERYAEVLGCPIYLGDLMLRADTISRYRAHEVMEHRNLRLRALADAECEVVEIAKAKDVKAPKTGEEAGRQNVEAEMRRTPLSPAMAGMIEEAREAGGRTFLFVGRKGLAPLLTCDDCGHTVSCGQCGRPLALYGAKKVGENAKAPEVRCRTCGTARAADDKCPRCGGWRLKGLGFGTETVAAEVSKRMPDAQVAIVDAESTPTAAAARKVVDKWLATPGAILVGTEMAANLVREEYECLGVVSADALLAVPEYRMRERVLAVLLHLRSHAKRHVLIQTRLKGETLYQHAARGTLADFYREELEERREYGFPPFGLLVRATVAGKTPAEAMKRAKEIAGAIPGHEPSIYAGREQMARGLVPAHALWKLPRDPWPDPEIVRALKSLPPDVGLEVDTDAIL
jgi:primosomal protein N' (replication factor Y)